MKRVLFIDRDGTLINEAPPTYQIDSFDKLTFYPHVFEYMGRIARELDYELVMISNQDGLGTPSFPEENFLPLHNLIMKTLEGRCVSTMVLTRPMRLAIHAAARCETTFRTRAAKKR